MKKNKLKWALVALGLPFYLWVGAGVYGMYQIEHFSPLTFDKILSSMRYLKHYGIKSKEANPGAFGAKNYKEVSFVSKPDNLKLSAWYVPPMQKGDACIVFLHGRPANRLRTVKYMQIYHDAGFDKKYCMFFLDFRNSGKSEPAPTALGYEFAEDLASALEYLKDTYGHSRFAIHAFSTGAMATGLFFHRPELQKRRKDKDIRVEALVLDSPLANIEESYHLAAERKFGLPRFVLAGGILFFGLHQPFGLDEMRLGTVAKDYQHIPVLILQGEKDETTPAYALKEELRSLGNPKNIEVHYFPEGGHVEIYQNPLYKKSYAQLVVSFLRKHGF